MEQNETYRYEDEMEIDLKELFFALLGKWYIIALSCILCALIGLTYGTFFVPETFDSKTTIYIYDQQSEKVSLSNLQTGSTLTKDYEVLVRGRNVLESTIEKLGLNISYEALRGMVGVNVPESTRFVEIVVRTTDPYLSRDIADTVREIASKNITEVMGVDAVNLVDKANLPERKSSPNISKCTLMGGIVGLVLSCGIIVVMFLFNDTICTQDDVEKYLGLSTLGIIPLDETLAEDEKKRKKTRKSSPKKSVPKRIKA